jgi:hypothetical protein
MKRSLMFLVICFSLMLTPVITQAQSSSGMSVTCDNGTSFSNGVEIVAHQMRVGYTYTAIAIGVNGFDPVLAVLDTQSGNGLCNDDNADAASYEADLPTTGFITATSTSALENFTPRGNNGFEDISLVVGGYGDQAGEFLLIIEGMGVTSSDGAGDPFSVYLTPGMVASGYPLTVYTITRGQSSVDPLVYVASDDTSLAQMYDSQENAIYCDDAGDSSTCYTPMDLTKSSVLLENGLLTTWDKDAALSLDISNFKLTGNRDQDHLTYVVTSYNHDTTGQYLIAFDIGSTDSSLQGGKGSGSGGSTTSGDNGSNGALTGGSEGQSGGG